MDVYQKELQRLLVLSTLCPASYKPSSQVKEGTHASVFVGEKPFMLLGPSDDMESITRARDFANSQAVLTLNNLPVKLCA